MECCRTALLATIHLTVVELRHRRFNSRLAVASRRRVKRMDEILHRVEHASVEKDLLAIVRRRDGLAFTDANRALALRIRAREVERLSKPGLEL